MNDEGKEAGAEARPQVQIQLPPEVQRGVYANQVYISHTQEEFVLDFILATPPAAVVNARVVLAPTHVRRLIGALQEVVAQYEEQFGPIGRLDPPEMPPDAPRH